MKTFKQTFKSILIAGLLLLQATPEINAGRFSKFIGGAFGKCRTSIAHIINRYRNSARLDSDLERRNRRHVYLERIGAQIQAQVDLGIQAQIDLQQAAKIKGLQNNFTSVLDLLKNNSLVAHYLIKNNAEFARFFAQINNVTIVNALDDYDNGVTNHNYDGFLVNKNKNNILVKQFCVRTQFNLSCGLHSTHNLFCFILGDGQEEDYLKKLFGDNHMFNLSNGICLSVNKSVDSITGGMVSNLLVALENFYQIPENIRKNITVIDDAEILKVLVDEKIDTNLNIEKLFAFKKQFEQQAISLFNGEAQYFLVCSKNHWVPLKYEYTPSVDGGVVIVSTANSYYDENITDLGALNRIYKLLIK